MNDKRVKIRNTLLFILILSIGISLRIYNLSKYDFWYDEIASILIAKIVNPQDIEYYCYLPDPPLFYFLLSFWLHLGNSEFILRLLPFIFGVLSIPAIYFVGKELFDKKVGLISAFILAISPLHIYYSQELRTYTLVTFLALTAIFYLVKSLKENRISYWISFIIFTTFTFYSHNITLFLIIAINCLFFLFHKKYKALLRRWIISQFLILLLYLPWVKIVFEQIFLIKAMNIFQWIPNIPLLNFIHTFITFNLGYNATKITHFLAILLFLPLFLFGICGDNRKEQIYLLLCWLFIPIIIAMIISSMIFPIYLIRTLIYVSTAYYIIIAFGLSKLKPNKVYLYFLLFFSVFVSFSLWNYYRSSSPFSEYAYRVGINPRKEFRLGSDYIYKNYQKGDIIGHTCRATYSPFYYYHNGRLEEKLFTLGYQYIFYFRLPRAILIKYLGCLPDAVKEPILDIREINKSNYDRIWLVLASWELDNIDQASKDIKEWLDRNYIVIENKEFVGLKIYLYQKAL